MADKISQERLIQIKNEIKMAEALNREELEPLCIENLRRYTGTHIPAMGYNWDIVLNEVYPVIQNYLPSIFFKNPRAFLKPRNKTYIVRRRNPVSGQMESVEMESALSAKTQEYILNYALTEINFKSETRKALLDALVFPHGILWCGYKGDFGMTEEQSFYIKNDNVFVKRVSPLRFLKDPAVTMSNLDEGQWIGRTIDLPLQDVLEDDKLDVDKSLIKGYTGFGEKIGKLSSEKIAVAGGDVLRASSYLRSLIDYTDKAYKEKKACRFIRVYEIYLRPTKKEARNGSKGSILLLTDEQEKPLRVNDWKVKAEGFPAGVLQFNELMDSQFGLCDIDTYKSIADQKNLISNLQIRNGQENSKTWVAIAKGGMTGEEDIKRIQEGENTIVLFEGDTVQGKMSVSSAGGAASSELYLLDQRIQRNLEDKSGVTDLRRGFLQSGEESAASVQIRAAGSSVRAMYRQDVMSDFLRGRLHYINQLLRQFMPYDKAVRIVGSLDLQWSENPTEEEIQADVDVEIDAISMLPENPETEMRNFMSILNLMMQGLNDPVVAQKIAAEGKTMNLSPIIEQILLRMRIRDPEVFRAIKPEESQGMVSVQQLREAKQNVMSALTNQPIQFPPNEKDDHMAKLEIYTTVSALTQMAGQVSDALEQLIAIQQQLLQMKMEKEATPGQKVNLGKPTTKMI